MTGDFSASSSDNQSVLVVGADGMIGRHLVKAFEREGKCVWRSTRRQAQVTERNLFLDLAENPGESTLPLATIKTAIICAAVTSMKHCRLEPTATRRINVDNTVALAKRMVDAGVSVIFLSSNTVFDGQTAFPRSTDLTNPQTEYGRQKAQAEEQLLPLRGLVSVVRFSKIIPPDMPLLKNWAKDLTAGRPIKRFSDGVMAPLSVSFAVDLLCRILTCLFSGITQALVNREIFLEDAARIVAEEMVYD